MTATFGNAAANAMLTTLAGQALFVSLHSATPGTTGASELSGDGYARQAVTWNAATGQAITNDGDIVFGPASAEWAEATYYGLWSAVTGGTFIAGAALADPVTVPNEGSATFIDTTLEMSLAAL